MSRVDFYVLSQEGPDARLRIACRLVEKAFDQNIRVYVQTGSLADAQRLDDMLWTFNERSFIPHEVLQGNAVTHERVMVLLGEAPAPSTHRQLLINLTNALPAEIEKTIKAEAGDVLVSRLWEERRLAYPIAGQRKGTYWLYYFRGPSSMLTSLNRQWEIHDGILRQLVLKIHPHLVDAIIEHAKSGPTPPPAPVAAGAPAGRPIEVPDTDDLGN